MMAQNFPDWSSWSNPYMELQKINQEASERVVRECIAYCSEATGTAVKCMQTLPRVTSPEDYFNMQMKILSQQGEKALEFTQNIFSIYQEALKNHFQWTEDKVGTTFNKMSKVRKEAAA